MNRKKKTTKFDDESTSSTTSNEQDEAQKVVAKFNERAFNPLVQIIKIAIVLILLLPWYFQIIRKIRDYEFIPKFQSFLEDAFSCPVHRNSTYCKCDPVRLNKTIDLPYFGNGL